MMRTIRQSFRRKKKPKVPESSRPHQWQKDEESVKGAKCSFHVKYLGCVEVQESRGMHVCEQAVKQLKAQRRKKRIPGLFGRGKKKKIRAMLYVSPDALRVVEDSTKALLLDQTIEKVSFCAPDRNHERAFSYICRDGTTRRWLCHSFFAMKESGERLSHAVGCAFAACLEKKQKREKETGVTVTFDQNRTTFTREGSFKVKTMTEMQEEEDLKKTAALSSDQVKVDIHNPSAVPRPHAPLHLLRQASMRSFGSKKQGEVDPLNSPFKRNYSLQLNKLPSNMERKREQRPIMNPVPEVEEESVNISGLCSQITSTFSSNNNDDPFAKAPMLASPVTSKQANGFDIPLKPMVLPLNPVAAQQPNPLQNSSSPVHDTNPWAEDARKQPLGGVSGAPVQGHRRTTSEADQWLQNVEQQVAPTKAFGVFPQPMQRTQNDPFVWGKPAGFQVSI